MTQQNREAAANRCDLPKAVILLIPLYNEQNAVADFYKRVSAMSSDLPRHVSLKLLFINDGSTDATEHAVTELIETDPDVSLLNLSRNFGKEAALAAGLEHSSEDAVIPIDVDLQDPPELIPEMVTHWLDGAQIVNAKRVTRTQDTALKRLSAKVFYRVFNILAEHPIPNDVGDFRLMDRKVVDVLKQIDERSRFNKALFSWVGFSTQEVTYERPARESGESGWSYLKLWRLALDGIFGSSTLPLRIWTYVGFGMALVALIYAMFIFCRTLIFGVDTPGYASTVILILMFGSMNMFALGIIGEYVGRIYTEVRQRPLYVVRSIKGRLARDDEGA